MPEGNGLKRKIGPLPLWGWGVGIVIALTVGLYFRRRSAVSQAVGNTAPQDAGATSDQTPPDIPSGGGTSEDTTALLQGLQDQLSALPQDIGSAVGQELAAYTPIQGVTYPDFSGDYTSITPPETGVYPAGAGGALAGFWWGGNWITKPEQLVSYEKAKGNRNFNLAVWASTHPGAATAIGLAPPNMVRARPNKAGGRIPPVTANHPMQISSYPPAHRTSAGRMVGTIPRAKPKAKAKAKPKVNPARKGRK